MPVKGKGRHPLRSTWLGLGRGRGRGRGLTTPVGKQILPSGVARVGNEVYSDWFFSETELKLYLRNTTANGISIGGVACYDLLTIAGSSADTAVVNTTASGTEIQFTKTAGGSVAAFITGRAPVGGWTITASEVALWLKESASTVNAGLRYRLFKYSGGTETEIGGSPFNRNAEFNTANSLETLAGNVTDTALAEDDRLLLRIYAVNVGTMAVGTATLRFNGVAAPLTSSISALTVTNTGTGTVDLTALGGADYHIYDATAALNVGQRKATGSSSITVAEYDPFSAYTMDSEVKSRTASATDATPTTTFSDNDAARMFNATALQEGGFQVTLPAGLGQQTAKIYVQAYHGTITSNSFQAIARFSDGSAIRVVDYAVPASGTDYYLTIDITYQAGRESQTIDIIWMFIAVGSSVTRAVHYLASWVSSEGTPPEASAGSYVNVYPAITFKAESGGVTGSGATSQAQTSDGAGNFTLAPVTGTGNTSQAQTSAGTGTHTPAEVTGSGATSQAQTSSASGNYALPAVTGIGTSSQAQSSSASASHTIGAVSGTESSSQAQTSSATGSHTVAAVSGTATSSQAQTSSATGIFGSGIDGAGASSQAQTSNGAGSHTIAAVTGIATSSQVQAVTGAGEFAPQAITGSVASSQAQTNAVGGAFSDGVVGTGSTSQAQSANGTGAHTPPVSQVSIVYGGDDAPKHKKHSKKETPYRDEIERLFSEAEQVYQPVQENAPQAQEIAVTPIKIMQYSYDIASLHGIIAELMNLRDNMSGIELDKLYIMRQELDRRRLFMVRARAALLL